MLLLLLQAKQEPNEFIVLNAAAYHAGYNMGFNCAEVCAAVTKRGGGACEGLVCQAEGVHLFMCTRKDLFQDSQTST
jgi:hypothetical protein